MRAALSGAQLWRCGVGAIASGGNAAALDLYLAYFLWIAIGAQNGMALLGLGLALARPERCTWRWAAAWAGLILAMLAQVNRQAEQATGPAMGFRSAPISAARREVFLPACCRRLGAAPGRRGAVSFERLQPWFYAPSVSILGRRPSRSGGLAADATALVQQSVARLRGAAALVRLAAGLLWVAARSMSK